MRIIFINYIFMTWTNIRIEEISRHSLLRFRTRHSVTFPPTFNPLSPPPNFPHSLNDFFFFLSATSQQSPNIQQLKNIFPRCTRQQKFSLVEKFSIKDQQHRRWRINKHFKWHIETMWRKSRERRVEEKSMKEEKRKLSIFIVRLTTSLLSLFTKMTFRF